MNFISHHKNSLFFGALLWFFVWINIWHLSTTLEFFSDMGRDHFVMLQAIQNHKPPLLGPSNSALPLNQSPIYYYVNFPVFILSGFSPYTTISTLILLSCFAFCIVYRWLGSKIFPLILLISLHPQFLIQTRSAWNPTFTVPFLLLSVGLLLKEGDWKRYECWIFSGALAVAIGCSYSVFPTAVVLFGYAIWKQKAKLSQLIVSTGLSLFFVFLPLLIVDLKTHFLLSRNMFGFLHHVSVSQPLGFKFQAFVTYLVGVEISNWSAIGIIFVLLLGSLYRSTKLHKELFWLLVISFLMTVLPPFSMGPHYIFGVAVILFACIVTAPKECVVVLAIYSGIIWLPLDRALLHAVPHRTVAQMEACAQLVCAQEKSPVYVSEQAWHSYHYSPDWLFMFAKSGCHVADITTTPGYATQMDVVVDHSSFEFGKTAYNELTLFGPARLGGTTVCSGNIQVVQLYQL